MSYFGAQASENWGDVEFWDLFPPGVNTRPYEEARQSENRPDPGSDESTNIVQNIPPQDNQPRQKRQKDQQFCQKSYNIRPFLVNKKVSVKKFTALDCKFGF